MPSIYVLTVEEYVILKAAPLPVNLVELLKTKKHEENFWITLN
jgi:hypothetical protein